MTKISEDGFAAGLPTKREKRTHTVGLRVTAAEKAAIERAAGKDGMPTYLRRKVLGDQAAKIGKPVRTRGKKPVKDFEALGQVLAALGRCGIADALDRLIAAQNRNPRLYGQSHADTAQAVDRALLRACADIAAMRVDLVKALGLQAKDGGSAPGNDGSAVRP